MPSHKKKAVEMLYRGKVIGYTAAVVVIKYGIRRVFTAPYPVPNVQQIGRLNLPTQLNPKFPLPPPMSDEDDDDDSSDDGHGCDGDDGDDDHSSDDDDDDDPNYGGGASAARGGNQRGGGNTRGNSTAGNRRRRQPEQGGRANQRARRAAISVAEKIWDAVVAHALAAVVPPQKPVPSVPRHISLNSFDCLRK